MSRIILILAVITVVSLSLHQLVLAHAGLSEAKPAPGELVEEELDEVRLVFTEEVRDAEITLLPQCEGCDRTYELDIEQPEPNIVVGKIDGGIQKAPYNVLWAVNSVDNHPISGTYSFTYDGPDDSINRYVFLIPFVLIVGIASFAGMLFVLRERRRGRL